MKITDDVTDVSLNSTEQSGILRGKERQKGLVYGVLADTVDERNKLHSIFHPVYKPSAYVHTDIYSFLLCLTESGFRGMDLSGNMLLISFCSDHSGPIYL